MVSNDKLPHHPIDLHWNTLPEMHSRNVMNAHTWSCKNNNPRKQKKEATIAEFIAGAAAYQNNDRK